MAVSGIRRLSEGALTAGRTRAHKEEGVDRKALSSAARAAGRALELRHSVRLVLSELVGCYGEQALDKGLMVWPSNDYLCDRTGLAERTLRKCIAELVRLALVQPVDSANRKRFAVIRNGVVQNAYGFNLEAIYARRHEFASLILEREAAAARARALFDELTIQRKAVEETLRRLKPDFPEVDCSAESGEFEALLRSLPRRSRLGDPSQALAHWVRLRSAVENLFYSASIAKKESGTGGAKGRHIESNQDCSVENCQTAQRICEAEGDDLPIRLVVEACPVAAEYGHEIKTKADLVRAGKAIRSYIQASPDAWSEVARDIGEGGCAALTLFVAQLVADDAGFGKIKRPGGLFRSIGRQVKLDRGKLRREILALRRRRLLGG